MDMQPWLVTSHEFTTFVPDHVFRPLAGYTSPYGDQPAQLQQSVLFGQCLELASKIVELVQERDFAFKRLV